MPVTPYHLGPAYLIKVIFQKYFSFRIFLLTQFVIDIESLYYMTSHQYPLHRFMHTYIGATLAAIFCIIGGRPICINLTKLWNFIFKSSSIFHIKKVFISIKSTIIAAFFGVYSHTVLDSIMHSDIVPFNPFTQSKPLYSILNDFQVHLICLLAGILGFVIYAIRKNFS